MALQKPYDSKLYTISATLGKLILQDHSIILNFNYFFVANCSVCPIDCHICCLFAAPTKDGVRTSASSLIVLTGSWSQWTHN